MCVCVCVGGWVGGGGHSSAVVRVACRCRCRCQGVRQRPRVPLPTTGGASRRRPAAAAQRPPELLHSPTAHSQPPPPQNSTHVHTHTRTRAHAPRCAPRRRQRLWSSSLCHTLPRAPTAPRPPVVVGGSSSSSTRRQPVQSETHARQLLRGLAQRVRAAVLQPHCCRVSYASHTSCRAHAPAARRAPAAAVPATMRSKGLNLPKHPRCAAQAPALTLPGSRPDSHQVGAAKLRRPNAHLTRCCGAHRTHPCRPGALARVNAAQGVARR
jgi:hypothetical protein